jgi:predicted Zn-dependent protease
MDRVAFFRAHLDKAPDDRFARYSLALELKKAGQPEEAEAELRRLLEQHPHSGAGHLQLGQLLEEQERLEAAKEAYEAGLTALSGLKDADARKARSELQHAADAVEDRLLYE